MTLIVVVGFKHTQDNSFGYQKTVKSEDEAVAYVKSLLKNNVDVITVRRVKEYYKRSVLKADD